jgi:hypothetical protein
MVIKYCFVFFDCFLALIFHLDRTPSANNSKTESQRGSPLPEKCRLSVFIDPITRTGLHLSGNRSRPSAPSSIQLVTPSLRFPDTQSSVATFPTRHSSTELTPTEFSRSPSLYTKSPAPLIPLTPPPTSPVSTSEGACTNYAKYFRTQDAHPNPLPMLLLPYNDTETSTMDTPAQHNPTLFFPFTF